MITYTLVVKQSSLEGDSAMLNCQSIDGKGMKGETRLDLDDFLFKLWISHYQNEISRWYPKPPLFSAVVWGSHFAALRKKLLWVVSAQIGIHVLLLPPKTWSKFWDWGPGRQAKLGGEKRWHFTASEGDVRNHMFPVAVHCWLVLVESIWKRSY